MYFKSIFQQTLTGTLAATLARASLFITSASADKNNTLGVPCIVIFDKDSSSYKPWYWRYMYQ